MEEVKRRLAEYLAAESAILKAQRYKIGDRELTRADLQEVRSAIAELAADLALMQRKGGMQKRAVLID